MQLNRRTRTSALLSLGLVVVMGITSLPAVEGARQYLKRPDAWYAGEEAKRIGTNILSFQSDLGGWPKNVDTTAAPYDGSDRAKDLKPTFDNGAIHPGGHEFPAATLPLIVKFFKEHAKP
ncbi:MAG: hypothetical protein WCO56_19495 [Verrucomicrobiota bacterium]